MVSAKRKQVIRDEAIAQTVTEHRGRLGAQVGRMLRDRVETDDILQEVFAELIEAYDLGQAIETVGAWLARVARNKVIDRLRRRKTQSEYQLLIQSTAESENLRMDNDPENQLSREHFRTEIIAALESLPPEQREVFVMHELEGKSFEEIAALKQVSVNTLLSRKRYAVASLRDYLQEVYNELGTNDDDE